MANYRYMAAKSRIYKPNKEHTNCFVLVGNSKPQNNVFLSILQSSNHATGN